ncbi:MAG: hypothetical protein ABIW84_00035 [Ilumatobacteraceae bacterium]
MIVGAQLARRNPDLLLGGQAPDATTDVLAVAILGRSEVLALRELQVTFIR